MCYNLGAFPPWTLSHTFYHGKGRDSMTNEELATLIQSGERDKVLELWKQVRRFALQQANRWARIGRGGVTVADLEQSSFLALLDALERWEPSRGTFLHLYSIRLKAEFTAATMQRTQRYRLDPLYFCEILEEPLRVDPDVGTLADVTPDPTAEWAVESVSERDYLTHRRAAVRRALDGLPADQRRAVVLRYWHGESPEPRALNAAMRALRHPSVSRGLRAFLA